MNTENIQGTTVSGDGSPVDQPEVEPTTKRPSLVRFPKTDSGNAERLAALYGDEIAYCSEEGKWYHYNAETNTWETSTDDDIKMLARKTMRQLSEEAARRRQRGDPGMQNLQDWARKSESSAKLKNIVREAQSLEELRVEVEDFDSNPWLLNTADEVIDLETGEVKPNKATNYFTRVCNAGLTSGGSASRWKSFIDTIFRGDQDLIDYVQRVVGYTLVGDPREQCLFLLKGGRETGKSTFVEAIRKVLGSYTSHTTVDSLAPNRGSGPTPFLARLPGIRFLTASELGKDEKLSEPLLKRITGGDTITARHLHGSPFEYTPSFTLFLISNHWPKVDPYDEAVWRRLFPIPFSHRIPRDEQVQNFESILLEESDHILNWAVEGAKKWNEKLSSDPPDAVRQAKDEWRDKIDRGVHSFTRDLLDRDSNSKVEVKEVHERYKDYCEERGVVALQLKEFNERLSQHEGLSVHKKRSTGGRMHWEGLQVNGPLR
jgi:putative DNA primase/helicase